MGMVRFRVCYCLIDYYTYLALTRTSFTVSKHFYKSKCHGFTIALLNDNDFVHVCYKYMYKVLLYRKFDEVRVNQVLNVSCQVYFAHPSYVERQNDTTKNCFGIIKHYLTRDNGRIDRDFVTLLLSMF